MVRRAPTRRIARPRRVSGRSSSPSPSPTYITPPKGDKEAEEQYVEVKYARARTYFESQHWEEAALAFRDVAINHADKDAGIFAAQLYLESINVLGGRAEPPGPGAVCALE